MSVLGESKCLLRMSVRRYRAACASGMEFNNLLVGPALLRVTINARNEVEIWAARLVDAPERPGVL